MEVAMFRGIGTVLVAVGLGYLAHGGAPEDDAKRFIGTWKLVSMEDNGGSGTTTGAHPSGLIYYDAFGNMAAQIMPDRTRPNLDRRPTPEQAKEALTGYTAYFGTYTVDEKARSVAHHRSGSLNPAGVGVDAVRRYEFAPGERLILTPVDRPTLRIIWERAR
jgi:hypothetical protein